MGKPATIADMTPTLEQLERELERAEKEYYEAEKELADFRIKATRAYGKYARLKQAVVARQERGE